MNIKPALKKRIVALYPDNIVFNLKLMDESLYEDITNVAKENNTTVKTLLESNGFSYSRKSLPQMYIEDYNEVLPLYEDKKVESLHESHGKLYYKLLNHAKLKGFTLKQYLTSLGFEYELKKESVFIPEIKKELEKIYKNKVIVNLSKTNPALYYKVYQSAAKENKTINVFLTEMGFSIPEKQTRHRRTKAEILRDSNKTIDKTENKTKAKAIKDTSTENETKVTKKETNTKTTDKKIGTKNTANKTKSTEKSNKVNETNAKSTNKANNNVNENKTKAKAKTTNDKKEVKTKTTPKNSSNTTKTEKETKKQSSRRSTSVRNASNSKNSKNQIETNEEKIENAPVVEVVQEAKE